MRSIGCLLVAFVVSGCGGHAAVKPPPEAVQRDVAGRFATAVLGGDVAGARALLVRTEDQTALSFLVRRAAAPWKGQPASVRLPARRTRDHWTIRYAGTRSHGDGSFETERGRLVVFVAPSAGGAGVRFFALRDVRTRYSTHHDAQLLPSNR